MGSGVSARWLRPNVSFFLFFITLTICAISGSNSKILIESRFGSTLCVLIRLLLFSYAEMPKEEKNKISHRSRALALVKSHFADAVYTS